MKIWRDIKDFILSYYYPKNQYFLVSFPKTGRTWLMHMICQIQVKDFNWRSLSSLKPLKLNKNFIFNEHDNSEIILENGTRNNPLDIFRFTGRNRYRRSQVLFLVRDPRDVIVSHFYQVTKRSKDPFIFNSISEFVRDEKLGFNRIIHFYNLWYRHRDIPKSFMIVRYEDLFKDGVKELRRISDFLDLSIDDAAYEIVYNNSAADLMRNKEIKNIFKGLNDFGIDRNQLKVRNAKIGGYKSELSDEDIKYCNSEMRHLNSFFGYKI